MQINPGTMQAGSVGGEISPPSAMPPTPPLEQVPSSIPVSPELPSDLPLPAVEDPFATPEQQVSPKTLPDQAIGADNVPAQQGVNIPVSPDVQTKVVDPVTPADNLATDDSPVAPPEALAGPSPVNLEDHGGLEAIVAGNSGLLPSAPEPNLGQVANADQFAAEQAGGVVPAPPSSAPEISSSAPTPKPFINTSGLPPEPPIRGAIPTDVTVEPSMQGTPPPEMGQDSLGALRRAEGEMSELQKVLNDLTPEQRDAWANFLKSLGYGDNGVETNQGEAQ